jgi:hypothetical protein
MTKGAKRLSNHAQRVARPERAEGFLVGGGVETDSRERTEAFLRVCCHWYTHSHLLKTTHTERNQIN